MVETVLQSVGAFVVASGGLVAIAWVIFRRFGEGWLDTKFAERLAALRHEQEKELEHLRFKINALLDRSTKLNQREFEVLPEAWSKLNDAFWQTISLISQVQEYPDFRRMNTNELQAFLEKSLLTPIERRDILEAPDQGRYYAERVFWHRLGRVQGLARESHVFMLKNGIFFESDLRERFNVINNMIWEALGEHEFNQEHDIVPREHARQRKLRDDGKELIRGLEALVRQRLWGLEEGTP